MNVREIARLFVGALAVVKVVEIVYDRRIL